MFAVVGLFGVVVFVESFVLVGDQAGEGVFELVGFLPMWVIERT